MKQQKRIILISIQAVFLLCTSILFSCKATPGVQKTAENGENTAGSTYAESRPGPKVKDELVVTFSDGDVELDFRNSYLASEAQIYTAIYEGLFSYHPLTMEPVPAAARRWEVSEDKKEWTFTIRENAKFQNNDPLRAEDFKASWLSTLEPERDAPYSSLFDIIEGAQDFRLGKASADKVGISCPDEKTLVVRLNSPAAFLPSMLCHHSFSPIHPSMLKEKNWTQAVSNGPFYIEKIDNEHILFLKNPKYWDADNIKLNKLTIKFTDDDDEASSMWNSGESRWLHGNANLEALTDRSGIEVNAMFATHYYYIRSTRKPWDDYRLRRALSLVLPWDRIRQGHALPAKTLIYPIPDYPKVEGLDTINAAEAERLMAEAGYPLGTGLPPLVIRITESMEASRIASLMAESWYAILGVKVIIDTVPFRNYYQSLKLVDYDVGATTWIGDFADPYTFLQMWRRDSNLNDSHHDNDEYEELLDKSMTEEGIQRWETLAEAEKLLLHNGNVLPISYSPAINIIDMAEIDGWYPNVLDIHPFKYLSFRTRRPLPGVVKAPEVLQRS